MLTAAADLCGRTTGGKAAGHVLDDAAKLSEQIVERDAQPGPKVSVHLSVRNQTRTTTAPTKEVETATAFSLFIAVATTWAETSTAV